MNFAVEIECLGCHDRDKYLQVQDFWGFRSFDSRIRCDWAQKCQPAAALSCVSAVTLVMFVGFMTFKPHQTLTGHCTD